MTARTEKILELQRDLDILREKYDTLCTQSGTMAGEVRSLSASLGTQIEQNVALLAALQRAFPILVGLCNRAGLDPDLLGYTSDGWAAKEAVRAVIAGREAQQ
jgi:hypothetical protein